jgi:gamma-glutamyl hercynylcysteine S-oxide synthase
MALSSWFLLFLAAATVGVEGRAYAGTAAPLATTVLRTNSHKELLAGPEKPDDSAAWLAGMRTYRHEMQAALKSGLGTLPDPYGQTALQWAQRSFIQPQMMAHERYFYDVESGRYTVDRYLKDLETRYGGIDSVLIWPTYPNIGIDNRNQFDLWRDMPGGVAGLRKMVAAFHRRGVKVLFPIMFWDHGTRDEGVPMAQSLAELARDTKADGLNGDTMSPVSRDFYTESLKAGHPLALEPENGLAGEIEALAWNVLSWGYWWPYQPTPAVDRYKFIEPRHLTHVCDRWAHDRTDMLQYAFFNGDGYESWENVWSIWNQVTPRDGEALRRISAIYRALPELLVGPDYEPFVRTLQPGVFATKFPGARQTLWTFINRTTNALAGGQISVPFEPRTRFFDLWRGVELKPEVTGTSATLAFGIEARGYGAVLAIKSSPGGKVTKLLAQMRGRAHLKLADLSNAWKVLPQRMVPAPRIQPIAGTPEGMVLIPAAKFAFESQGVMIEKSEGVGVQYPWEDQPRFKHKHELSMAAFYMDRTPVTCAQFKQFLDATEYRPKDAHNFLRDWTNAQTYPDGWARKPVTWVSLEDARAYARWAGKRLPHEWEWQYAAQGTDGRLYPWGNQDDPHRLPPFDNGRDLRPPADVDAFPQGASPFGVLDLVGNVWQWTDEMQDEHTRSAILKGGSHYRPEKSHWYFPQARQLNQHGKYLLLAPSIDRSACIGFRCVADAIQ